MGTGTSPRASQNSKRGKIEIRKNFMSGKGKMKKFLSDTFCFLLKRCWRISQWQEFLKRETLDLQCHLENPLWFEEGCLAGCSSPPMLSYSVECREDICGASLSVRVLKKEDILHQ